MLQRSCSSLRVRHFDGTETDTAEWTHRNALAPQCPMPNAQCPNLLVKRNLVLDANSAKV
ncbi:hypothetical protein H6G81_06535 [Scytonema hofmannii FACHB-248]|uniref:Uncharacterized protein n=1 Tax=Scytonema hofmannii FACHB-248 TaxID=1842502 RepID=A0ABR8GM05_9CYAN|nr:MULTISPECIES: hypothetical protein [Nostocales]MBD2604193.1 hypothetical protein [Scytonema hofmannii FACHB-248]